MKYAFFHVVCWCLGISFQVSFSDFAPYLIATDVSLDALNEELPFPISMVRFRPNIVVSGLKAFQEVCSSANDFLLIKVFL